MKSCSIMQSGKIRSIYGVIGTRSSQEIKYKSPAHLSHFPLHPHPTTKISSTFPSFHLHLLFSHPYFPLSSFSLTPIFPPFHLSLPLSHPYFPPPSSSLSPLFSVHFITPFPKSPTPKSRPFLQQTHRRALRDQLSNLQTHLVPGLLWYFLSPAWLENHGGHPILVDFHFHHVFGYLLMSVGRCLLIFICLGFVFVGRRSVRRGGSERERGKRVQMRTESVVGLAW